MLIFYTPICVAQIGFPFGAILFKPYGTYVIYTFQAQVQSVPKYPLLIQMGCRDTDSKPVVDVQMLDRKLSPRTQVTPLLQQVTQNRKLKDRTKYYIKRRSVFTLSALVNTSKWE